jgi:ATP-dependent protease HslVU (ClpYQ) peptidase subunit
MSVVVAIKKDGIIYMGADSQVSRGGTRTTLSNPNNYKIWALRDVDNCLMGAVGTLRANNIIKVADDLIPEIVDIKQAVSFRFVVKHLVPRMFDELDEYKVLTKDNDDTVHMDASFLLAYHDRLYSIDRYGSVIEVDDFCAIGSGANEALGSLLSTIDEKDPVERIKTAIKASAAHDLYVDYPIVISNTEDTEFKVYYEKDL